MGFGFQERVHMVEINIAYQGELRSLATHGPSHNTLITDAPVDNMGKGQAFSPTDLVATALGTCMLTIMGIVAQRHGLDIAGTTATVLKDMAAQPVRRIGRLSVTIDVPTKLGEDDRRRLEHGVHTCPVLKSLHPDIDVPVKFVWA
jgi:putative redox protein